MAKFQTAEYGFISSWKGIGLESRKIMRSAGMVGVWIMISRFFGLLRDMLMAAMFASSMAMDAFVVAFTIPNLFRGLFGEGALSSAFVPVFTETLEQQGREQVWKFALRMLSLLTVILTTLTIVGLPVAVAMRFAPLSPRLQLIGELLMIMLPYLLFICLSAFFAAMLNALRKFALPAATPIILNLTILSALILICPHITPDGGRRIRVVAWSVLVAGLLQAATPLLALMRQGFRLRWDCDWRDSRVRRVLRLMAASSVGVGVTQINVLVDRFVAVWIGQGSPSYLYYAERLIYLPLGVFATALSTVLLPTLSTYTAQDRRDNVHVTLNYVLRQILFIMLPAAAGMLFLAKPIVSVVYQHGDFTEHTARMTALALACYAPGLVVFSLIKVLVPVFYARQDMRTPVKVGIACSLLNLVLNLILMWPLRHAGIAIATVAASTVHVIILALLVHRQDGSPGWRNIAFAACRLLIPTAVMTLAALATWNYILTIGSTGGCHPKLNAVIALTAAIACGGVVYLTAAFACRCREAHELLDVLRRRRG
ncbi:MAG: murein biosynthesis integral membrane protein MurJ [Kiritimatiellia bacterium]